MAGFEIKRGWHVNIDATCIHYDPDLYPDPMQFNPSRFDVMSYTSLTQLISFVSRLSNIYVIGSWHYFIFCPSRIRKCPTVSYHLDQDLGLAWEWIWPESQCWCFYTVWLVDISESSITLLLPDYPDFILLFVFVYTEFFLSWIGVGGQLMIRTPALKRKHIFLD